MVTTDRSVERTYRHRYTGDWVVSRLLVDRAERLGDRPVVTEPAGHVTYGELATATARTAGMLASMGVSPGDRVATMLDPGVTYLRVWFASAWAGAIEVPVNTDFKGRFLEHVLRESGARVLVIDARWVGRLEGLDLPELRGVVTVGAVDGSPDLSVELVDAAAALPVATPLALVDRSERDPVYVMYTSGTSGASKGAIHSNRSALWNAYAWLDVLDLGDDDVAYSMFPLFHVTARSAVVTSTIWAGGAVALRHGFSVSGFWDDVRSSDSTFFAYMGSVIHLLFAAEPTERDRDHRVRRAFGAAAPPEVIEAFERRFGFELLEVYGSTELGLATAPRPGSRMRGTMGTVCDHLELQIHDPDGHGTPVGIDGEIVARPRTPHGMFQGYWANAEATVSAWEDLWFHTGDRGHLRADGNLVFVDRIKDTIRRRGENISSFEVERAVQQHPDVLEAAAYAVPSDIGEEEVALAVVVRDGASLAPETLFRFCVEELPRFAVPRYIGFTGELPKTPSQRVQKYKLREAGVTPSLVDRHTLGIHVPRS